MMYREPSLVTMNKKVAVEPFPDMAVKTTAQGQGAVKVARIENKVGLTRLRVVFPSDDGRFRTGQLVWVRSDLYLQNWAKEKHQVEGVEFILMPESHVEVLYNPQNSDHR